MTGAVSLHVRIPPALLDAVDAWIVQQECVLTRREAIRRLTEKGLAAK
jgi:hypothetical protein